jgi:hypothetical protein
MYKKLLELRKKIKPLVKDANGYNYKYFDINQMIKQIMPLLEEMNMIILQPLCTIEGKQAVKTILADTESKDKIEEVFLLPQTQDPQKMRSAITYFRRYSLQSMLFLEAEDDDGAKTKKVQYQGLNPQEYKKNIRTNTTLQTNAQVNPDDLEF